MEMLGIAVAGFSTDPEEILTRRTRRPRSPREILLVLELSYPACASVAWSELSSRQLSTVNRHPVEAVPLGFFFGQ